MGFESRDYAWESPSRRAYAGGHVSAVKVLVAINAAVFVLQLLTARAPSGLEGIRGPLDAWLGLIPERVLHGEIWRLLTYSFLHGLDLWHILINMYLLWVFGQRCEARMGAREFTLFYLAAALCGGVFYTALELIFPAVGNGPGGAPLICVGASGAVMGVVALIALWEPHSQILLFFLIPVPLWALAGLYALFETYYVLLQIGAGVADNTAHGAHFGGLLLGLLYVKLGWNLADATNRLAGRFPRFSFGGLKRSVGGGPKVRLHRPDPDDGDPDDDLERRGDAVLAKIHATGESSLTRSERKTLKLYSERAKARRDRR